MTSPMFAADDCVLIRLADVDVVDLPAVVAAHVAGGRFAVGGHGETRRIYGGSGGYPPSAHLGLDVWGRVGDAIIAPFACEVVDVVDHAGAGDFGPTATLRAADGTLLRLAHLSRASLAALHVSERVEAGKIVGRMGTPAENGGWPAHVHVQIVADVADPGVVPAGIEAAGWLRRCPDPGRWVVG